MDDGRGIEKQKEKKTYPILAAENFVVIRKSRGK